MAQIEIRSFERYLDCSQTPTTEQVLQYVRFEQTHDQEATSRTDMGVSLFMLRASHPAFRPAFCCTDTRPACAKCAQDVAEDMSLFSG